jgi:hypothetical protein
MMAKGESSSRGSRVEGWGGRFEKWIVDVVANWGSLLIEGVVVWGFYSLPVTRYPPRRFHRQARPLAERESDSETGESASLLGRKSGSEAPDRPAGHAPFPFCLFVSFGVIRG